MRGSFLWLLAAALVACDSKAAKPDDRKSPKSDPWATSEPSAGAPARDPWAATGDTPATAAQPRAAATTPANSPSIGLPEGEWTCSFLGSSYMNGTRYTQPVAMPGFRVHGNSYTAKAGDGTLELEGLYVSFHGGGFDNWRGALNTRDDKSIYIVFSGSTHRDSEPGTGARFGDVSCKPPT